MIAVALTDLNWFLRLRDGQPWREVNFWTPTPWGLRSLSPRDRFYFLLKAPIRKVSGYGDFSSYEEMSITDAWNRFGPANGTGDLASLIERRNGYVGKHNSDRAQDTTIGCIILQDPVFLDEEEFRSPEELGAPVPRQVVKYKTFPELQGLDIGATAIRPEPFTLLDRDLRYRNTRDVATRTGQREFRSLVPHAYAFTCAVTGETCPDVLEAAHIQPYLGEASNNIGGSCASTY